MNGWIGYEALNQLSGSVLPVLVVINENQMSIDPNVDGISKHLLNLKTGHATDRTDSIF
ncbi:MAG: hypothetical protein FJ344_01420 [Sphingomonadales bacterium]|nr:hypothetical protein [Sphingomonadales bacterium]